MTEIDGLEGRQGNEIQFIFDPAEFLQRYPTPTLTEFRLDEGRLRELAIQGSQIRAQFQEKAIAYGRATSERPTIGDQGRTRRGLTYSVASRDLEGLSEKEKKE